MVPVGNLSRNSSMTLAELDRPESVYVWYYSTREADNQMRNCPPGIRKFPAGLFPREERRCTWRNSFPLQAMSAVELAKLPTYYVMDRDVDMAATVAPFMPSREQIGSCQWMTDADLDFYAYEYLRTGFQGGLNWYRCRTTPGIETDLGCSTAGSSKSQRCLSAANATGAFIRLPGALRGWNDCPVSRHRSHSRPGHWVQQEAPEQKCSASRWISVVIEILNFPYSAIEWQKPTTGPAPAF